MMYIYQNPKLKELARRLRQDPTPQEELLWNSYLKHYEPQMYRQYVIGNYIVDFFCRKAGLAIEIDGMQHYTPQGMVHDEKRTIYIEQYDVLVIRVTNFMVERDLENVCQYIDNMVQERVKRLQKKRK